MSEFLELAKRVEDATGPDRILDRDIEIAIQNAEGRGYEDPRDNITARKVLISHGAQPYNYEVVAFSGISLRTPREYTASIDAAKTAVPEGCAVTLDFGDPNCMDSAAIGRIPDRGMLLNPFAIASGVSAAHALTSACLKARTGVKS